MSAQRTFTLPERWTLLVTVLGSSMAFLDGTVVNVALSSLQRDLGASAGGVQWVVNAYALMLAALTLAGGALGDAYGRRRVYGAGVAVFALASLACGLAPDLPLLLAARTVQGVGAALLVPGSLAMIGAVFAPERRGRGVGLWSAASSVTTLLGPLLGGLLVDAASWRWVFLINLPLAAGVLLLLPRVPETRSEGARPDWPAALLVTGALFCLAFALTRAGEHGWDVLSVTLLPACLLLAATFVWWERRAPRPMIPRALQRDRAFLRVFVGVNLLTFLLYGGLGAVGLYLPLYLIGGLGYTAAQAGAALLPLSLLLAALSGPVGALADRRGPRLFLTAGPLLAAAGFLLLGRAAGAGSGGYRTTVLPAALVLGLGMALTVAPLSSTVMGTVPRALTGVASGVNNAVARAASLLAVAALGLLLVHGYAGALDHRFAALGADAAIRQAVVGQAPRLADLRLPAGAAGQPQRQAARAALGDAFRQVTLAAAGLAALAGLAGLVLVPRRPPPPAGGEGSEQHL